MCALLLGPFGAFGALALPAQAQPSSQSIAQGRFSGPLFGDVDDLKVGDCFNTDDELKDYEGEDRKAPLSVDVVPCDESHQSEAFAVFDLRGGPYPGDKEIDAMAEEKCAGKALTDYVGADAKLPETMTVYYYAPREGSWSSSDRVITCFLGDTNGPSTGSVRAAGS
ncbi:septum formation family protein [Streptomyces sp. NPDC088762]|uniref:septum formation family protein n=1 Tax=Streptomyces sp. NPDC088762 TaxID=3365891 RepID=UPI00380317F1